MSDAVTTAPTPWDYGLDGYWIDWELKDDFRGMPVSAGAPYEFTLSNGLTLYKFNDTRYQDATGAFWDLIFWDYPEYYTFVIGTPTDYACIKCVIPAGVLGNEEEILGYVFGTVNSSTGAVISSPLFGACNNVSFSWDNDLKQLICYYDYSTNPPSIAEAHVESGYSVATSEPAPEQSSNKYADYPVHFCARMFNPDTGVYSTEVDWSSLSGSVTFKTDDGSTLLSDFSTGSALNTRFYTFTAEDLPTPVETNQTITIKDPTSGNTLCSFCLDSGKYQATLTTAGLTRTLTLTNSSEEVQTLQWANANPSGKELAGLGTEPNGDTVLIPEGSGNVVEITVGDDITWYEEYTNKPYATSKTGLYINSADPRTVDKTNYLTLVTELSGTFRTDIDIVNPTIRVQIDEPNFNYAYLEALGRYYYVVSITHIAKNLWEVSLQCDVLMTYRDGITSCYAYIDRTEDSAYYNQFIVDSSIPFKQGKTVATHFLDNDVFPTGLGQLVLTGFLVSQGEAVSTVELQSIETDESEVETDERTEVAD